jgi:hypothetical protein
MALGKYGGERGLARASEGVARGSPGARLAARSLRRNRPGLVAAQGARPSRAARATAQSTYSRRWSAADTRTAQASLAADRECRRLDPQRATSVNQTWALMGEWELAHELGKRDFGYFQAHCRVMLGRHDEALAFLRQREPEVLEGAARLWLASLRAGSKAA